MKPNGLTAVVLAADRNADDPLLKASGVPCKALIEVGGVAMLQHVLSVMQASRSIQKVIVSGPAREHLAGYPPLADALQNGLFNWVEAQSTPSTSAHSAMQALSPDTRVLLTTTDHPLLRADIVDQFLDSALQTGADVVVGLVSYALIQEKFPGTKKTVLRFSNGHYCGCNLFAFLSPQSRRVAAAWRQVEQQRKNPLRLIGQLGWWSVLRYLTGRLSLEAAFEGLSRRLEVNIKPICLPFAEAAIDVDSLADHKLVEEITGIER
jgi:2-C-methyl-D-erythritol 4-phosphate cytidylyltransferase